jgi:hypothetical protein
MVSHSDGCAVLLNFIGSLFDKRGFFYVRSGDFSNDAGSEFERRMSEAERLKGPDDE